MAIGALREADLDLEEAAVEDLLRLTGSAMREASS